MTFALDAFEWFGISFGDKEHAVVLLAALLKRSIGCGASAV